MAKIYNRALLVAGENKKVGTPVVKIIMLDKDNKVTRATGATTPTDGDAGYAKGCMFVNTAGGVGTTMYINEGSATSADFNIANGTGGGGVATWDALYALDQTLDINGTTLTFDRTTGNGNVQTITNTGGGSGVLLQITNAGTGADISGTSGTWSFSKLGVAVMKSATLAGTAGSDSFTLTAGDMVLSDASLTITDADNAATLSITNNTATTATVFAFAGSGAFTGSTTTSFMTLTASGLTTGTVLYIPVVALTTGKAINIVGTTALTTGILVNIESGTTGTSLTGAGRMFLSNHTGTGTSSGTLNEFKTAAADETILLALTAESLTTGSVLDFGATAALTTGTVIKIAHTTSVIADGGSLLRLSSSSIDTGGATNGTLLDITSTAQLAGTIAKIRSIMVTGTVASIASTGIMTTTGNLLTLTATSATTAAGILRVSAAGLTSGIGAVITAAAATLTTGRYLSLNDGALEVFGIGANGHIHTAQTTAPVMTTNATGISATTIIAGSSDVAGGFTTVGTPASGTVLTCTFHKTYTAAPKAVAITPLNAAAGNPNTVPYVSSITATTFVLTWPAAGTYAATPSYAYMVIA